MPDPDVPKGLVLFPPGTPPAYRRRRLVFFGIWVVTAAALVWPLYPLFGGDAFPLVLGLPWSLAWLVGWLGVIFGASVWLYRSEGR